MINFSIQYRFLQSCDVYIATVGVLDPTSVILFQPVSVFSFGVLCGCRGQAVQTSEQLSNFVVQDIEVKQAWTTGIVTDMSLLFCKIEITCWELGVVGFREPGSFYNQRSYAQCYEHCQGF